MTITDEETELEKLIVEFISARKHTKVEAARKDHTDRKLDDDALERRLATLDEEYAPTAWISDAAKRASQIRIATHIAKAIHPDSKASNLRSEGAVGSTWFGTPPHASTTDMSGNAAALDVNGFLSLCLGARTVGDRLMTDDPALSTVLRRFGLVPSAVKEACSSTFVAARPVADTAAKQVYFRIDEEAYHLLIPLYPSSLVHEVHGLVREARFGQAAKAAREARRTGLFHAEGLVEYPDLVLQMFGSGKPQNVSLLTNARRGEAYHFPSYPPAWDTERVRPIWGARSVFDGIFPRLVRRELRALADFLNDEQGNNLALRERRAASVHEIVDALVGLELQLAGLEPGWSANDRCVLADEERLWLDAGRSEVDEAFWANREHGLWRDEVAGHFARWLNAELARAGLPVGDAEHRAWRDEALEALGGVANVRRTEEPHVAAR